MRHLVINHLPRQGTPMPLHHISRNFLAASLIRMMVPLPHTHLHRHLRPRHSVLLGDPRHSLPLNSSQALGYRYQLWTRSKDLRPFIRLAHQQRLAMFMHQFKALPILVRSRNHLISFHRTTDRSLMPSKDGEERRYSNLASAVLSSPASLGIFLVIAQDRALPRSSLCLAK